MNQLFCRLLGPILPRRFYVSQCTQSYVAGLARTLDTKTRLAEFEPNGEALWENVRRTIEDFLLNEFQVGALVGDKPEQAYHVRCDRTTMTQNDIDNGRLICVVGVAPVKPAEFVIFRICQWTGSRKPDP
jgi:phage tail sheath protein FI